MRFKNEAETIDSPDVIDAVIVQAKAVGLIRSVNQELDVAPNVLCQLLKEDLGLLLGERTHRKKSDESCIGLLGWASLRGQAGSSSLMRDPRRPAGADHSFRPTS